MRFVLCLCVFVWTLKGGGGDECRGGGRRRERRVRQSEGGGGLGEHCKSVTAT